MSPLARAILEAWIILECLLFIADFALVLIYAVLFWTEKGLFGAAGMTNDEFSSYITGKTLLWTSMLTLWGCTWWWLNGPMCLYWRFVLHDRTSTFLYPRGTGKDKKDNKEQTE